MKKILLAALLSLPVFRSFTQIPWSEKIYSRIDALRQKLPSLTGNPRIDCLDSLALAFSFGELYTDWDSVNHYALAALEQSKKVNYVPGIYSALYALGHNDERNDLALGERRFREMIEIANNDSLTAIAKANLGECLSTEAKYDEALENFGAASVHFEKQNDLFRLAESLAHTAMCFTIKGDFEKAFQYTRRLFEISSNTKSPYFQVLSRITIADLYMSIADYPAAKKYLLECSTFLPEKILDKTWIVRYYFIHWGNLFLYLNQPDSALYYYNEAREGYPSATIYKLHFARVYMARKDFDMAIPLLDYARLKSERKGAQNTLMQCLLALSEAHFHKGNYKLSLLFANKALQNGNRNGAMQTIANAYSLLYRIHESMNQPNKALEYYKKYITVKDSLISDQFKAKLYDYKRIADDENKLAKIDALRKQTQISEQHLQIQRQRLRQKTMTKNALVAGIALIVLLSVITVRNIALKRRNEHLQNQQMQSQLQRKATELEMRALRAQMNPHFIFNCLTSINRFILKNESEQASDYLTKFSRLIRMVLTHSQSTLITLTDELEMLRLYLDMEQLRFKKAFDYSIRCHRSLDADAITIPPLLLQPFCENAIWHGLMHKTGHGHLSVELEPGDNMLSCTITDNGVGRQKAGELKTKSSEKQKSLGLKITTERLALYNREHAMHTSYQIEDLINSSGDPVGTKVILKIHSGNAISENA